MTQASFALKSDLNLLLFLAWLSLGVYVIILGGWVSNNKYSMLGSMRAVSQAVSYELVMSYILLLIFLFVGCFMFSDLNYFFNSLIYFTWSLFIIFFICSLAETNRTPYDLMEGESELVSGFNTEFFSGFFAVIFMAEYLAIMVFSWLMSLLWWSDEMNVLYCLGFHVKTVIIAIFISLLFLVFRATYPRTRYDLLLIFVWDTLLPFSMVISLMLMLTMFS